MLDQSVNRVVLLAGQNDGVGPLMDVLGRAGLACHLGSDLAALDGMGPTQQPQAVLVDLASLDLGQGRLLIEQCKKLRMPVVAVVPKDGVTEYDPSLNPDELVFHPVHEAELLTRVKQAIYRVSGPLGSRLLRVGELTIDLERYEVTVAGRRVSLKLQRIPVAGPSGLQPRQSIFAGVATQPGLGVRLPGWYRTVDVHVRRLRSKIESPGRTFIETIYQVGYRFRVPT